MLELCLASERLAAGSFPAAKLVISTAIAGTIVARHGPTAQRAAWLPGIAAGSERFCFAFTEPGAGRTRTAWARPSSPRPAGLAPPRPKTYISALESSSG
jgi:alkylation response protein AidB-like acyl-CoA dehydrogenase